jgi:hypothetical protein
MKILGYEFHEMTQNDWYAWAGAESGTLICKDAEDRILLWDPKRPNVLYESVIDNNGRSSDSEWTREEINTEPGFGCEA